MKKGFTLIELLAVIIILAIIALIATPVVLKVVDNAKLSAFKNTAYGLIDAGGLNYKESILNGTYIGKYVKFQNNEITPTDIITVDGKLPDNGDMKVNSKGQVAIAIYDDNLKICAYKKFDDAKVTIDERDKENCNISGIGEEVATDTSCFQYEDNTIIDSYDLNHDQCVNYFVNNQGWPEENIGQFCDSVENASGLTLNSFISKNWISIDQLTSNNVISNIKTHNDGIKITGYTCGGYYDGNDNYYDGSEMNPIIPSKIDNKDVKMIAMYSFTPYDKYGELDSSKHSYINDVIIPNSVTTIGEDAFQENQLASVTIPNSVISIGEAAFESNQLTSISIPNSVTSIGVNAFYGNQLTSLTLGNGVTTIGEAAFANNQLTSATIPDSVTSIGFCSFCGNQLASVTIPNSVISIGQAAFESNQLTSVTIPDSVTSIGNGAFYGNQLTSLTLGNGVTTIGESAFAKNQLTSITIPNSTTSIETNAFFKNNLSTVVLGTGVSSIGTNAFYKLVGSDSSNSNLDFIFNDTGNSFNWSIITGSSIANQIFVTGFIEGSWLGITVRTS